MLVKRVEIVPLEVIVRNARLVLCALLRIGWRHHLGLPNVEFCYKDDSLGDPQINEYHIRALKYATDEEVKHITAIAFRLMIF